MEIYFFTAFDKNPVYRKEAEALIQSGKKYGRKIHPYDIPDTEIWNRYKPKLIGSELPKADRYVYLDSDTVLTCYGDWESQDCQGCSNILYHVPEKRLQYTSSFIRNHTICDKDPGSFDYIISKWRELDFPIFCNSGVVVIDADKRIEMSETWLKWQAEIDRASSLEFSIGDEAAYMFARNEKGWPFLPQRFNGLCKWQPIYPWHQLIHADGNVGGEKRLPYIEAVKKAYK